ncbi:phosphohistidine swiveling domain-containing protein [Amycolatopsis thermophila]|uniref:Phosphohistidine swiveling domain-containing protein n=2 Tax=Amycolatopsis thermophila TaxID=206084 RepID=A0ABU0F5V4_9PSEU|nr:phosphohistidine swiveling domain-containing protein [Amycolatopsis thermophila]
MSESTVSSPKWGSTEMLPLPGRFNGAVRALAAQRFAATGARWKDVVFERQFDLFSLADARAVEQEALDDGYRFDFSATVSLESEPDKYKRPERETPAFTDGGTNADGRRQVGVGDNVIRKSATVTGPVALISRIEQVMGYLADGIPEGTIAVIDDSGGTLTAPIIEGFAGVICLGGTVRSHLGILAREYDVPTLMNCKIDTLSDGDVVELEVTAAPPAADAYETGDTGHARIWLVGNEG